MNVSLVDALFAHVKRTPHRTCLIFLHPDGSEKRVTYEQLHRDALSYAGTLKRQGVQTGELALLVFEHSYELVASFWGAIYCRVIPSIFPYYEARVGASTFTQRIKQRVDSTKARALITLPNFAADFTSTFGDSRCRIITTSETISSSSDELLLLPNSGDEIAYIQFSSGTTGLPKGVMLAHQTILDHISAFATALQFDGQDIAVGWLPLYHDMGLVTQLLLPQLTGACSVLIAPSHWVRRPATLLRAIHTYEGTMSWMPNFAFNHCIRNVRDKEVAECNLSTWRILGNGSELVQWESLQTFATRFAPYNFKEGALTVGYGMAENVVATSLSPLYTKPHQEWIIVTETADTQQVELASAATPGAKQMVSCGSVIEGTTIAIVDEADQPLPDRYIGEVVLKGSSLFSGYYKQPELTAKAMRNGWYHTGDLGYLANGQLYLYERKADVIIVGGHNVRPYDIEQVARSVLQRDKGKIVAFGLFDKELGTEVPVVVCEMQGRVNEVEQGTLIQQIRQRVRQELDVTLEDVRLVRRGWIVKTTSGKIARAANRQKYIADLEIL